MWPCCVRSGWCSGVWEWEYVVSSLGTLSVVIGEGCTVEGDKMQSSINVWVPTEACCRGEGAFGWSWRGRRVATLSGVLRADS